VNPVELWGAVKKREQTGRLLPDLGRRIRAKSAPESLWRRSRLRRRTGRRSSGNERRNTSCARDSIVLSLREISGAKIAADFAGTHGTNGSRTKATHKSASHEWSSFDSFDRLPQYGCPCAIWATTNACYRQAGFLERDWRPGGARGANRHYASRPSGEGLELIRFSLDDKSFAGRRSGGVQQVFGAHRYVGCVTPDDSIL
jgi:hypothetical protein